MSLAIAAYCAERGMTQKALASAAGLSKAAVSNYMTGRNGVNPRNLLKIANALAVSVHDLLSFVPSGTESDRRTVIASNSQKIARPATVAHAERNISVLAPSSGTITSTAHRVAPGVPRHIPYLPVRARATFAESFADDSYQYEAPEWLEVPGVPTTKEFAEAMIVEVDGDSMDAGQNSTLRSGARVLVTPVPQADWQYLNPGVYCVVYRSYFVIKRIKTNTLMDSGLLTLHSDNELAGSFTVQGEDIRAVWRVRWGVFTPVS